MKAMVTGANGFVGPHLVAHLEASGDEVVGLTQTTGPDLTNQDAWIAEVEESAPDVIYHLAGWSDVGASWNDPQRTALVNTMGTLNVLGGSRQETSKPRVVFVSSADVYGQVKPHDLPLTEESPLRPCSPYGASKQAAEALALQSFRGFGVETIIARPFNHIGPGQAKRFIAASFAAQVAQAEQAGGGSIKHGDLSPRRDISDVRDVVRAYRLLGEAGKAGGIYNICSGKSIAMAELLTTLTGMASVEIATETDPTLMRPVDLPVLEGSNQRINQETGWKPTVKLASTLEDILAEARTQASRTTPGDNT